MNQEIDRFLRMRELIVIAGLAKSTIYNKINNGTFPQQIKIGERASAWRQSEIDDWMNPLNAASEEV